jgi:preprotein translocase subunit SecY
MSLRGDGEARTCLSEMLRDIEVERRKQLRTINMMTALFVALVSLLIEVGIVRSFIGASFVLGTSAVFAYYWMVHAGMTDYISEQMAETKRCEAVFRSSKDHP